MSFCNKSCIFISGLVVQVDAPASLCFARQLMSAVGLRRLTCSWCWCTNGRRQCNCTDSEDDNEAPVTLHVERATADHATDYVLYGRNRFGQVHSATFSLRMAGKRIDTRFTAHQQSVLPVLAKARPGAVWPCVRASVRRRCHIKTTQAAITVFTHLQRHYIHIYIHIYTIYYILSCQTTVSWVYKVGGAESCNFQTYSCRFPTAKLVLKT